MKTIIHDPELCRASEIINTILCAKPGPIDLQIGEETFPILAHKRGTFVRGMMAAMSMMDRERETK